MTSPSKPHYRFFQTESSNEENSRILDADHNDVEYEILYFQISCVGATSRSILAYGKAKWTNRFPQEWEGNEEFETPFRAMPILTVQSVRGQAKLAESFVIDLYLAKKFGLLGSNSYEEATIQAFYSSIHYLRERSLMTMTWVDADKRLEAFQMWTTKVIPRFIKIQEQHLERNGSNGHFFGDKITLADIHLVGVLDHFAELPRGDEIINLFRQSPLLWKVRETVLTNPDIAAWRQSEEFAKVVEGGKKLYSTAGF
ncbi:glutathione S-transferase [Gamsiella multidivaricata]|uniref:glutathione S-transferase n=1 Tax=Gamsiella multidivaricata TaxID=101098 RepID=UPI0022212989|nr:glutathione S-transferase [Gamsiella multidivaricata]KAG0356822.1 hypothetical protein BGZ54_000580 [Gamsiella multidivaricata]KAI7816880.1 glutathione S-transferase [Gamsiella multidivaricata]